MTKKVKKNIQIERLESVFVRHRAYIIQSTSMETDNVWQLWHIVYFIVIYHSQQ